MLNGESLNGFGPNDSYHWETSLTFDRHENQRGWRKGVRHVSSGKSGHQSWEGILQVWFKHLNSSNSLYIYIHIYITCNMHYIIRKYKKYLICVQHVHPFHFSGWSFIDDLDIIRSYVKLPKDLSISVVIYWSLWHAELGISNWQRTQPKLCICMSIPPTYIYIVVTYTYIIYIYIYSTIHIYNIYT